MNTQDREKFLVHIMNSGFERAASSFSKLINRPMKILTNQSVIVRQENKLSFVSEEKGELYILITHIIGDVSGKSFLIFNQEESQEIFNALNTKVQNQQLNEAFLLEIDNIISASVISDLSNALDIEVYGDVPHLIKINSDQLHDLMESEIEEDHSTMIFSNTTFHFENRERVHPQFIWKLSSKIFDLIPQSKMTA